MTIRSRGISEKIVYAHNPLPKISESELLEAAGLEDLYRPAKLSPFMFTWKYGSGLQAETVHLGPGEFVPLRQSEAKEFLTSTNASELGMCVVESTDADSKDTRQAALAALAKAAQFYFDGGSKQLSQLRKRHNYSEQDMQEQKSQFYPYFLNKAKEAVIRARIAEIKSAPKKPAVATR